MRNRHSKFESERISLPGANKYLIFQILTGLLLLSAVFCLPVASSAQDQKSSTMSVSYKSSIEGVSEPEIIKLLESISDTFNLEDTPPATKKMLQGRVDGDVPRFITALKSQGYFKAKVETSIDGQGSPVKVVFKVDPGPPFLLDKLEIIPASGLTEVEAVLPEPSEIGLEPGARYVAEDVLSAQNDILTLLGKNGFPFPEVSERQIVADFAKDAVDVTFKVEPGVRAVFGQPYFEGLVNVNESYVQTLIPWQDGDPYDLEVLAKAKNDLMNSGLFSIIEVKKGQVASDKVLPITISVTERSFRTVSLGLGWQTDIGLEGRFKWEHRNLFGGGEKLFASLTISRVESLLKTGYRQPNFLHPKQTFLADAASSVENTKAYDSRSVEASTGLERQLTNILKAGAGVKYRYVLVENGSSEEYGLVSFPVYFNLDTTDDLFDPSRGGRLYAYVAPYVDTLRNSPEFYKYQISYSHYLELLKQKRIILAGRALWGCLSGAKRKELPRDELFYAGGGGSVRGYAYQTAGDMTIDSEGDDEPVGGMSIFEVSGELRFKVAKNIGVVTFLDGGRANATERLDTEEGLFWGAGLGLRYFTPIGPVRLDVAVPLNRREDLDAPYQIYLGLGQSF